ncbi:MAG: TIGR04255 family protein [Chryseotalea sp. WA131a]|jgi:uncharacterized protein (TIGR04255 family)|nr:MAG: TIGR04255 family protein [Chryseotalea sp. WA131a]
MEFKNHKITEAVCAFRFDPSKNPWDVTFFSYFFDKIKQKGFDKKQEIKPVQLNFEFKGDSEPQSNIQHGETQMVFKTTNDQHAILMGNNYISFHSLNHYSGWDVFKPEIIDPNIAEYFGLGLGNGVLSAQMIYINNFDLESGRSLADYFKFVPNMKDFGEGEENSHFFQSNYTIAPNKQLSVKTVLNTGLLPKLNKRVILECNCIANNNSNEVLWNTLADDAHSAARNAFIQISSDYFKSLIK